MTAIRLEKNGDIATVTLSNPGKLNAVSIAMWQDLTTVFTQLSHDTQLRCVILRGEQGNFAAGADIAEFPTQRSNLEQGMHYHRATITHALAAIAHCLHPTIAAIEGVCVGGGLELACACDLRIASADARFGIPIKHLGFALAPDEMQHLLQLVGRATALEILLEGRIFAAAEARDKGLLHRVVENVQDEAQQTARRIAQGAPLAARLHKQLIRRLSPPATPLSEQEYSEAFSILNSQDYHEGVQAFIDKKRPNFQGK